ncbi:MAG: hypothetical protein HY646_08215, partial [Acidobacteria bacterium]|nr:hypothetical protein [Acidobacteriota bacterium]
MILSLALMLLYQLPFQTVASPLTAVDPDHPGWIYVVVTEHVHSHLEETRLYRSTDGGRHWTLIKELPEGSAFRSIEVEPGHKIRLVGADRVLQIQDSLAILEPTATAVLGIPDHVLADRDSDGIAVLEDDGGLLLRTFNLDNKSYEFRPSASGNYDVSSVAAGFDTDIGTRLDNLADDASREVTLPFTLTFYGRQYTSAFVNANGNVSFDAADADASESAAEFFSRGPKIAGLWDDLDPSVGNGGVFVNATMEHVLITWQDVPEFGTTNRNTFQIFLFPSGVIRFHFGDVAALDGLTGISNGAATAGHYVSFSDNMNVTGLSAAPILELFATVPLHALAIGQRFYQTHDDVFDALAVFGASELPVGLAGPGATAFHSAVRNDVRGIGRGVVDSTASFGSGGRLQSYLNMNSLAYYGSLALNPAERLGTNNDSTLTLLGQEWGHRFLAYVRFRDGSSANTALLGRGNSHWNYFLDSEASVVEGNEWRDNGDGAFLIADDTQRYSRLDQYLMGLRRPDEVPPLTLVTNPEPLVTGTIASVESTFGRTNNAIRDTGQTFDRDRYTDFQVVIEGTNGPLTTTNTARVISTGRTDSGSDPSIINTGVNLI